MSQDPSLSSFRNTPVYCDGRSENVRAIFADLGFRFVAEPREAELLWVRKGYRIVQPHMLPGQLVNHLPNELTITNKGNLTDNLKRFDRIPKKRSDCLSDFYQESYCLYLPEDRALFLEKLPPQDHPDNLWIVKPAGSSRGRGIKILWQVREKIESYIHPTITTDSDETRYIIQRYIKNPLLLHGRKSELRIYWLIASLNPLLVLLYREGTARLTSQPFRLDDFDNTLIHVANVYQQKIHPEYDPTLQLKWTFTELERYLVEDQKLAKPGFLEAQLRPHLKKALAYIVDAARGTLTHCVERGHHFGLYGADVMLDDTLHPWITEVQKGPGLSFDDPVKKEVIPPMVREAAAIALEVHRRKRENLPLRELHCQKNFEWVTCEA